MQKDKTIKQALEKYNKDVDFGGHQYIVENFSDMTYAQIQESISLLMDDILTYEVTHFILEDVLRIHEFRKHIRLTGGIKKCSEENILTIFVELKIIQKNYETRKANHNVKTMFGSL